MNQIIIKFTTDFKFLVGHLKRYVSLYNHIYDEHINGTAYFEVVENGMIAFYRSLEDFHFLISPKLKQYKHSLSVTLLLRGFSKLIFPKEGIIIITECVQGPCKDIFKMVNEYLTKISPHIDVDNLDELTKSFKISIKEYKGVVDLAKYLFKTYPEH